MIVNDNPHLIGHPPAPSGQAACQAAPQPGVPPRLWLAVAAVVGVVAALAGCSTTVNKPSAGTTSSSLASPTGTTTAASGNTPTQSAVSNPAMSPATATASATFVGHWHVHGAMMDISPTSATIVTSVGPCSPGAQRMCEQTDTLAVVSGDNTQLTLVVTAVNYADNTGAPATNPSPGPSTAVGDSLRLVSQAPGLLKATILHGFPEWLGGNPYWCGQGISQSDAKRCGA